MFQAEVQGIYKHHKTLLNGLFLPQILGQALRLSAHSLMLSCPTEMEYESHVQCKFSSSHIKKQGRRGKISVTEIFYVLLFMLIC